MSHDEEFIRDMAVALRERKREKHARKNSYPAGDVNRLTADWPTTITSPTTVLRSGLRNMRARARNLYIGNDYARRFIAMVGVNVAGPDGIGMQSKAKFPDGMLDKWANDQIEKGWEEFSKKGTFDVSGQISGLDADRISIQTIARDGEQLVREVRGFDNGWNLSFQFLEADHLDESLNVERLQNGNSIRMGKEFDPWFRPVAYHLLAQHPGDSIWSYMGRSYIRVPAEEIIHPFMIERFNQPRGVPWMHSAMTRLNNIGAYEEAAIMKSRLGASAMGIWEQDSQNPPDPATNPGQDDTDADGTPVMEMEPGVFVKAPLGYKFQPFDPGYPTGDFAPFMKSALRGIASGLLVSYNSLASDLEGVNFSSIRAGVLEERDCWKVIQAWMIQNYKQELFIRWLRMALLTGKIPGLPFTKFEKFSKPKWQPRTWDWVDPERDVNSKVIALENKLLSWTKVLAADGIDLEEHCAELKNEKEIAAKYGVELTTKSLLESAARQAADVRTKKQQEEEKKKQPTKEAGNGE